MRIGCCTNFLASKSDGTGKEFIEGIAKTGFDYLELPMAQSAALTDEEFSELKNMVTASGLRCESFNNFFPASVRLTGNEVDSSRVEEYVRLAAARAEQMGTKIIVFGSSAAKNVPKGFPMDRAYKQIVEHLRTMDRIVGSYGITILIEPLNRLESNIINTVKEGLALMREVDRPNIKLLADYYHMALEKEDPAILIEAGKDIIHMHFAEETGRVFPKPEWAEAYLPFFQRVKEMGYCERLSIEAFSKNFDADAGVALEMLRRLAD